MFNVLPRLNSCKSSIRLQIKCESSINCSLYENFSCLSGNLSATQIRPNIRVRDVRWEFKTLKFYIEQNRFGLKEHEMNFTDVKIHLDRIKIALHWFPMCKIFYGFYISVNSKKMWSQNMHRKTTTTTTSSRESNSKKKNMKILRIFQI